MVCRTVKKEHVRAEQHHSREHTSHLFASGENIDRLVHIVAREEHTSEEAAEIGLCLVLDGILSYPVKYGHLAAVEILAVVHRHIRSCYRYAPLEAALVRLLLLHKYLEEHRDSLFALTDESDLVGASEGEADVIEQLYAVNGLADALDLKNVLAKLPVHIKADERVSSARSRKLLDGQLLNELTP